MAYVKVNRSKFESTASSFEEYARQMRAGMQSADDTVARFLGDGWSGDDYIAFKNHWDKLKENDSSYKKMLDSIEHYASFLKTAANKYKEAQQEACNKAEEIPG